MYFFFGIPLDCINTSSVCVDVINFPGSSWVLFEAAFVIFSGILFPTRSEVVSVGGKGEREGRKS